VDASQIKTHIAELSREYGVQEFEVISTIEDLFSRHLSRWHNEEVLVRILEDYTLDATAANPLTGNLEPRKVTASSLKINSSKGFNSIRRQIGKLLYRKATLKEASIYHQFLHDVVEGEIALVDKATGRLYVELEMLRGEPFTAICEYKHQTPYMRKNAHYLVGEKMDFHLNKIEVVEVQGVPRINIYVDRTSKTLVTKLLKRHLNGSAATTRLSCVKRIVGGYSLVLSSQRIPQAAIVAVDRALRERIRVFATPENVSPDSITFVKGKIQCSDLEKRKPKNLSGQ